MEKGQEQPEDYRKKKPTYVECEGILNTAKPSKQKAN